MKLIYKYLKRYSVFLVLLSILFITFFINYPVGTKVFKNVYSSFLQMLSVLPPIMLLLGLMDAWIPKETLIKYMGDSSGILGICFSMLIGSLAAGPMYAAFPFTALLLKKGAKFSNIIIFLNSWCVTKVSTLLFELSSLGFKFTFIRLLIDIPGVIMMGYLVYYFMDKKSLEDIYSNPSL